MEWYDEVDRSLAGRLLELPMGQAMLVARDVGPDAIGTVKADPGPGWWNAHLDLRTEQPTRSNRLFVRGREFAARHHAPGHCPAGPCGQTTWLTPTGKVAYATGHLVTRCQQRGIDVEAAMRVARQEVKTARLSSSLLSEVVEGGMRLGITVAIKAGGGVATAYRSGDEARFEGAYQADADADGG